MDYYFFQRVLFLAPLLAIGYAAYSKPAQDDYEDYGGGGGYGGPAPAQRNPVQPQYNPPRNPVQPQYNAPRNPVQPQYNPPPPASQGGDYDQGYDVAEEWKPYSFSYSAQDTDGSHSHQQQADSKNRVTGQYSIMMADGRMRIVKYVADENGFRAEIVTNEQGTESKNPADVTIQSSAQTGEEAAKQYGNDYSNNRYDNYAATPENRPAPYGGSAGGSSYGGSAGGSSYGGGAGGSSYGGSVGGSSYGGDAGGPPSPPPPPRQSYSNSQSYAKQDSQSYSNQNNQGYSQGQADYHSTGYSQSREYNQGYSQQAAPAPRPFPKHSGGSYSNDIPDIEDHEDQGYYSGAGPKTPGRRQPSYGR